MYPFYTQAHPVAVAGYSQQVVGQQAAVYPQMTQLQHPQAGQLAVGPDGEVYMFVPDARTASVQAVQQPQYQHVTASCSHGTARQSTEYNPYKPDNKHRFHLSLVEYNHTEESIMFARSRDQGVSVIEILRGAPKVHDGASKAFLKPTITNFQIYWPGYEMICIRTTLSENIARLHLAEFLCQTLVNWIDEQKKKAISPLPGCERWDVRHSRYHPSNLWLWGIRKVKNYSSVWLVDLFVEP